MLLLRHLGRLSIYIFRTWRGRKCEALCGSGSWSASIHQREGGEENILFRYLTRAVI